MVWTLDGLECTLEDLKLVDLWLGSTWAPASTTPNAATTSKWAPASAPPVRRGISGDYFQQMYDFAIDLIKRLGGVCLSEEFFHWSAPVRGPAANAKVNGGCRLSA